MTDEITRQFDRELAVAAARRAAGRDTPPDAPTDAPKSAWKKGWFKALLHRIRYPFGTAENSVPKETLDLLATWIIFPIAAVMILLGRVVAAIGRAVNDKVPGVSTVTRVSYPWLHRMARLLGWLWNHGGGWLVTKVYHWACCDKIHGEYVANPVAMTNTVCFAVFMWLAYLVLLPPLALAGGSVYYYGTWASWDKIYVPNTGVHQSQNFVHPNGPGEVIAARDEIYTVLGKYVAHDKVEEIRFDVDYNFYFWFYEDSLRPDLAASKLTSQAQFGVLCDLETTGIYSRLPRFIRISLVKWLDLRPEIVRVKGCDQLQAMPDIFLKPPDYPAPRS